MSVHEFLIALTLGAGALALWINFRFPNIAPDGLRPAVMHMGAALLVGQIVVPGLHSLMQDLNPMMRALLMTFALGLPALVYALLSSIWIIRIAQGAFLRR